MVPLLAVANLKQPDGYFAELSGLTTFPSSAAAARQPALSRTRAVPGGQASEPREPC